MLSMYQHCLGLSMIRQRSDRTHAFLFHMLHASLFQQAFSNLKGFLSQTFLLTLNQMHLVVFSESAFYVENLLHPPDIPLSAFLCVVSYLLAPCWSPGH